ncbi:MAG: hypothetical protein AAGE76_14100 [Pseudomonadota bacterium]
MKILGASITDWISATSALVASVTALFTAYFAYKQYLQPPFEEKEPEAANIDPSDESEHSIVVFETSRQRTYLKIVANGIECWLLDKRTNNNDLKWTIERSELANILQNDQSLKVTSGYKVRTGTFQIGQRKNWLYSKDLYPDAELFEMRLEEFLKRASTQTE